MSEFLLTFDINGYPAQYVIKSASFGDAMLFADRMANLFDKPTTYKVEDYDDTTAA